MSPVYAHFPVLGVPSELKYSGAMERVAREVRALSTAPEDDLALVLKRALFAWLIADGDMHLKNLALLKIAEPGSTRFSSVRLAPLYDGVTTRVFPRLQRDRMALKLNGKDDRLRRADFKALAAVAGLRAPDAEQAINEVTRGLSQALDRIVVPSVIAEGSDGALAAKRMREIVLRRLDGLETA